MSTIEDQLRKRIILHESEDRAFRGCLLAVTGLAVLVMAATAMCLGVGS